MLDTSAENSRIGISVGFAVGLGFIYGIEHIMEHLERRSVEYDEEVQNAMHAATSPSKKTYPKSVSESDMDVLEEGNIAALMRRESIDEGHFGDWENEPVELASQAISSPKHKHHIETHLHELSQSLNIMESKSRELTNKDLNVRQTEDIAESIDEEVHRLQYKLDHCRR